MSTNSGETQAQAPEGTPPTEQVGTRVMFENERVRVWDLALAPGEALEKHIHRTDYFFIVESGGLIRFSNPDDPSDCRDVQFQDDQVTFREVGSGKIDNRLTNIGTKRHRNYVIELKTGARSTTITPPADAPLARPRGVALHPITP